MVNHDSFEQTALPFMSVLRNYALHLTMDSQNADDLLQDTYLKAYRFWGHFEKGTNIKAWLCRIMKNSHINRYRKGKSEPPTIRYEEYHLPQVMTEESVFAHKPVFERSCDEVFGDEVIRSIESMNELYGKIILLADVHGLSYEEIAKSLSCPMGTVRSRLHRGRKLLKQKLFVYARDHRFITKTRRTRDLPTKAYSTA
jgi:RNA polymerase sigma-70 factor, ECF subfamily